MSDLDDLLSELNDVSERLYNLDQISVGEYSEEILALIPELEARQSELRDLISDLSPADDDEIAF